MKQETLYEAFLNCLINKEFKTKEDYIAFKGAEFGAKWQRERSYSEEDMTEAFRVGFNIGCNDVESPHYLIFEEWFKNGLKKFKNK